MKRPAQVFAFPPARHRKIVAYVVGQMSKRRTVDAAEEFLTDHLWMETTRLEDLGISDGEIERFCRDFAIAAWTVFFEKRKAKGVA
ncbi:DUF6074 family protein [Bradyrhizobium sp. 6(2017)]|uniref:DUF6074 family protein n=1 Tax=Bradyrhizobium sp. 6(2017) TaxID=1197460 RepID=UPI0013E17D27|nr:DUF6074 family protein [Bradyrhizobium sp. 6(2017)]QIG96293.1 hypothetical protein G6P99_30425 [Bradyrhizobium sp. 6(2017)]